MQSLPWIGLLCVLFHESICVNCLIHCHRRASYPLFHQTFPVCASDFFGHFGKNKHLLAEEARTTRHTTMLGCSQAVDTGTLKLGGLALPEMACRHRHL